MHQRPLVPLLLDSRWPRAARAEMSGRHAGAPACPSVSSMSIACASNTPPAFAPRAVRDSRRARRRGSRPSSTSPSCGPKTASISRRRAATRLRAARVAQIVRAAGAARRRRETVPVAAAAGVQADHVARARRPLCRDGARLSRMVAVRPRRPRQLAEQQFRLRHRTNLALMIDNPRDLVIGRTLGPADAEPTIERRRPLPHRTGEAVPRQRRHRYGIGRRPRRVEPILEFVGQRNVSPSASGGAGSSATAAATGAAGAGGTGAASKRRIETMAQAAKAVAEKRRTQSFSHSSPTTSRARP